MPNTFQKLLDGNDIWVANIKKTVPGLFDKASDGQHPQFLWIGCADSRVPAEEITNSLPGAIFVHRNIANMVVHTDYNLLSVVHYAIYVLKVKHIIICGHYCCGGIKAAMGNSSYGIIDNWLGHLKDVYRMHRETLRSITDADERERKFVELNVQEQVNNTAKLSFVQEKWTQSEFPYIHGWIYNVENGSLLNLNISINSAKDLDQIFQYAYPGKSVKDNK
jgi:carbonic anhydrase